MSHYLDNVRKLINDAILELETQADSLITEQDDSEAAHLEWEEEREKTEEPEPDVVDHSEEIGTIGTAVNHLEDALDVLKED